MKKILGIMVFLLTTFTFAINEDQKVILDLVNRERIIRGLKPMKLNSKLNKLAKIKSDDMHKNNYFSHNSPIYGSPFDLMKRHNVNYMTAGENIAKGQNTPEFVMKSWMNSSGHRKNILNPRFKEMGVSRDKYGNNIWTQMFIGS
ncbi:MULTISPECIES: CAP domain-containing protein [Cetobacterium]|uniref:CAP domain-containing protein n=1 Tax=Candidatus Cetobacterium colombiensis TaxID=3073100 RepID=A0ABU4WBJ8_9FUSO|nr:CAP domain-containing protein [Candidatus Cetobacterium colombiensis]MDX8336926.1 CAP domain-containing protein [Candidatus Cetobacterium colombiensis]